MNLVTFDSADAASDVSAPLELPQSRHDPDTSDTPVIVATASWGEFMAEEIAATLKEIAERFQREAGLGGVVAPGLILAANVLYDHANETFATSMLDSDRPSPGHD